MLIDLNKDEISYLVDILKLNNDEFMMEEETEFSSNLYLKRLIPLLPSLPTENTVFSVLGLSNSMYLKFLFFFERPSAYFLFKFLTSLSISLL